MGRIVVSAVVGYLVIFVFVFGSFSIAYLAMGTDRAFLLNSYDVSDLWIAVSLVLGFVAAAIGGKVSAAIARDRKGPFALAGIVFVLGIVMAACVALAPEQASVERTADVSNLDAMQKAVQPLWVAILNPVLGVVGVLLGAGLRRPSVR